jgi:ABC-type sugar transport system permease subunit
MSSIFDNIANSRSANESVFGKLKSTILANRFAYIFLLPFLAYLVFLIWFPFLRGVWMSFHEWSILGSPKWVGLQNYSYLLSWDPFVTSLIATLWYLTTTIFQLGLALLASLALANVNLRGKLESVVNGIFLIPYTMPPVVTGVVWLLLLDPLYGPVFQPLVDIGVLSEPLFWSSKGQSAMAGIIAVGSWTFWPFMFIIIYASREAVPDSYYESAKIYGASKFNLFRHVTLPQIKSAILVAVSIRIIWNLAKISQPYAMTKGGPVYETSMLAVLLYEFAWRKNQLGMAYTIGIVLFVISLSAVFIFLRESGEKGDTNNVD